MKRQAFVRMPRQVVALLLLVTPCLMSSCAAGERPGTAAVPLPSRPVAVAVDDVEAQPSRLATASLPAQEAPAPSPLPTSGRPSPTAVSSAGLPSPTPVASPRPPSPTALATPQPETADGFYAIGAPTLRDLYISPTGSDSNSGASRNQPLRTIGAAWSRIPEGPLAGTGYRLNLLPGTYSCEGDCANYFADRTGTHAFPILLQAADGPGTVTLQGGLNLANVHYLYLIDLTLRAGVEVGVAFGNNVLHIENGDHILLRRLTVHGPTKCITDACNDMQEVVKVNQSQSVFVEQSDIAGAFQTALDFFSVQTGHLLSNHIHRSGGRCAYLKGGSAYFRVAGNEFDDCREAGFQAGEGSNLAFMRSPWLHYEAYDVKVYNNVFHDIYGASLSVAGGYNILMAFNTLYRVGLDDEIGRPWPLVQLIHGWRGCVSADEFGGDAGTQARCQDLLKQGGWGTSALGYDVGGDWIPNRNVLILNNIFYNPAGAGTHYVHFVVNGPITPPTTARNVPAPSTTDAGLVIRGNVIWNRPAEDAGLVGDNNGSGNIGCRATNPTCNPAQLQAENAINSLEPLMRNPGGGNFGLRPGSSACALRAVPVPDFDWRDAPAKPAIPSGELSNAVPSDRNGLARGKDGPPGAFVCEASTK